MGQKKKGKLLIRILSARGVTVPNSKAPCVWRRSLVAPAATLCWVFTDHMPLVRLTLQTQNKALSRETNNILKDVVVERLQILRMRGYFFFFFANRRCVCFFSEIQMRSVGGREMKSSLVVFTAFHPSVCADWFLVNQPLHRRLCATFKTVL